MAALARRMPPPNPGGKPGRPRGLGMLKYIAKATEDGQLMASFFVRVLKGLEKGSNVGHKIKAAEWLADRFAGKAVEIALTGDIDSPNNPLAELDADQLKALIHKIAGPKNTAKPAGDAPPADVRADAAPQQTDIGAQPPTSVQTPENT